MSRRNKRRKEEICEDFCFVCKDGGLLIICDYKDCLKAYHLECVEKDETFLDSGERWNCGWHSCFICHKVSKFHCLCCPQAVCGHCIHDAEFVVVKGNKGLCQNCLTLALLYEDGSPVDSGGVTVDFGDEKTHEFFFTAYWEYIKRKEGLTKESIRSADELLKKGKNYRSSAYFLEIGKIEENIAESEEESHCIVSDYDDLEEVGEFKTGKKRSKSKKKSGATNKKEKSNNKEFVGWGSKLLLEFLNSVNKDTSKPMAERDVVSAVQQYCKENKLFDPQKRKRIICDEKLRCLFRKKFVLKNSLSKLLAVHFASNVEESSGDGHGLGSSSDDEDVEYKSKRSFRTPQLTQKEKENPEAAKSCYALVTTENIKLVYLKRSLVDELLKQGEEFEKKVVGSFVRVKCNPNDYLQRNSHQLLQVKGVTTLSNGQILLQFFNCPEDFPINKLSDDIFTEDECEDLISKVKDGLLKKPTIVELEQKARSLHKDMINHWIPKELALLQRRVDQANEKGWRREMSEYLDRIELLNNQNERQRLLNEFPEIIAEPVVQDLERDDRDGCISLPESPVSSSSPQFLDSDLGSDNFSYQTEAEDQKNQSVASNYEKPSQESHVHAPEVGDNILEGKHRQQVLQAITSCCKNLFPEELRQNRQASTSKGQPDAFIQTQLLSKSSTTYQSLHDRSTVETQSASKVVVIELSDDDQEEYKAETVKKGLVTCIDTTRDLKSQCKVSASEESRRTSNSELRDQTLENAKSSLWYCRSALGHKAGPFKMSSLKNCFETRDQELEIKVWKQGGREEDAILLEDLIRKLFP